MRTFVMLPMVMLLLLGMLFMAGSSSHPKAKLSGMTVTSEQVSYGYEGDPNDGYLSSDEDLIWMAGGSLASGESYTYTYKGREVPLQVEIVTDRGSAIGMDEQCFIFINSVPAITNWAVTVRNTSGRLVRRAALWGLNQMELGQPCP